MVKKGNLARIDLVPFYLIVIGLCCVRSAHASITVLSGGKTIITQLNPTEYQYKVFNASNI